MPTQLDILMLDMFASQTRDLYHIETDRKGGYIEFAARQIYRAKHIDKIKSLLWTQSGDYQAKRTKKI